MSTRLYNSITRVKLSRPSFTAIKFSRLARDTPAADIVQTLKKDGCVVVKAMFGQDSIQRLNTEVDTALANTTAGKGANTNTGPLPDGTDAEIFGQNTKRLGDLLNCSSTWREEMIDNDVLHDVSGGALKELGDYWLSTAQMIEIGPGSKAQPLHADGAGWWPFWSSSESWKPEFTLNFLIAVTDTTVANGATGVVRNSHNINYGDIGSATTFDFWNFPDEQVEQVELNAGDCLILSGRIVHRGEENKTKSDFRRILSCTVISSSLTPEEAHPLILHQDLAKSLPERVKKFLGFRSQTTTIGPDVWQHHKRGLAETIGF